MKISNGDLKKLGSSYDNSFSGDLYNPESCRCKLSTNSNNFTEKKLPEKRSNIDEICHFESFGHLFHIHLLLNSNKLDEIKSI